MKPLRSYQAAACDSIVDEWTRVRSTLLVAATGTGKTRMGGEICQRRRPFGKVLWLAHRTELLDQAQEAIAAVTGLRVGREQAERRSAVRALWGLDDDVVVASVQTMHGGRLAKHFRPEDFDTIIVDEAHHAVAPLYREVIAFFSGAKVLGVTATPDRGDRLGLNAVFESVAYQYDTLQGIAEGYLCDIQAREVVLRGVDISNVRVTGSADGERDLNATQLAKALDVDGVMHAIAHPLSREAGTRQTIVFMPSVDSAHHLCDVLRGYVGADRVRAIDGTTATTERRATLAAYRAKELQYVINCAVLTEGFDAPETSCVAIARPTKSRSLYAQMIGRGTRVAPGKSDCLVLDFVPEQAGKHKLVTPRDVLGGKDLPDDVAKEARDLCHDGMPCSEALAEAEKRKADRQEQERLREEAKLTRLRLQSAYIARSIDVFGCVTPADCDGAAMNKRTAKALREEGVSIPNDTPQKAAAKLLTEVLGRRKRGECSYKQARNFQRWGLRTNIATKDASYIITAILNNGPDKWRNPVPHDIKSKYGAVA